MSKRLVIDSGVFFAQKDQVLVFGTEAWILRTLFNICSSLGVYDFCICWDSKKSIRKELFPEYKVNRKAEDDFSPEEWERYNKAKDITRKTILPYIGITNNFRQSGFEADDLIAKAVDNSHENIIVSNDRDLYQLLADNGARTCSVYHPMKKKMYTFQDFHEEFGIEVWEYVNYKALQGDSSDNIPGLKGIGPKKALQIVKKSEFLQTRATFPEIIDRNLQLMELPLKGCADVEWMLNQPDRKKFEKAVDRYNLDWFLSPMGMGCANKFFEGYRASKVRKSIRIGKRGSQQ